MQTDNLLKQVAFIKEIDKLKYIQRKTKLFNSDRCENDAEHSWHLAMMAIVLAEHSDHPIDVLKVVKMVLIHDIVEIDAGDVFIYDTQKNHTNTDEELIAAKRVFGLLPTEQAEEFIAIWQEFEDGITNEAKFAKSMDRFEPLLQNTSNNGGTWREFNVPYQKVYDKKKVIGNGSQSIWNYAEGLINESVEKGILFKEDELQLMQVRKVSIGDIDQLQSIGRQTFTETFSAGNTEENLTRYLDESFSVEKLTAELNDEHSAFYFAELNNEVIGYLKVNFGVSQTEIKDDKALEIERIYVQKAFHGKKVAQLLYNKAIDIAKEISADYVWLGVWEENQRAISFYKKNGFVAFDKHIFRLGDDEQTDIMMKLQL